ncbi:MAG: STAS domain-containing protein [Myxococcales bacterium]|nr:STAS domain-containing protein [Myxococcales bacterium]
MKILTYGEIMEGGASVFQSVAKLDGDTLSVVLEGAIRADNPGLKLQGHVRELTAALLEHRAEVRRVVIDFVELEFCNSSGFYVVMDLVESVYRGVDAPVTIRRVRDDDWQQETLPILIDIDDPGIHARTRFDDVDTP